VVCIQNPILCIFFFLFFLSSSLLQIQVYNLFVFRFPLYFPSAVRPAGAAEPVVSDAAHLLSLLRLGKKRRATAPTDVNGGSSRSHAVCQVIRISFAR
jgi:hypothetical protein